MRSRVLKKGPSKGPLDPPRASTAGRSPSALTRVLCMMGIFVWPLLPGTVRSEPSTDGDSDAPPPLPGKGTSSKTLNRGPSDASERRIQSTANGLSSPGLFNGEGTATDDDGKENVKPAMGPAPELHVVQKGDTLWSLCSKYFGDPWRWPRLWAANPVITNPHWIFPGDVVRLGEGAPTTASAAPAATAPAARTGLLSVNRVGVTDGNAVLLREMGFIEAKDLDQAATITGSREEKIMLASTDQAYLRYPDRSPLKPGERYSVFTTDTEKPVVDATTGKTYGYLVHIVGDIVINQIAENDVARGTLADTVAPIERGARISAFVHQFKRIEARPSDVNLEARVIASFAPNTLLGPGHFVVLNRGKRDGVQIGNRTFVIRRGDGYRGTLESWEVHDPNSPREVVGEILVVDVREEASVAWIARTTKELRIGELTEMRKGH